MGCGWATPGMTEFINPPDLLLSHTWDPDCGPGLAVGERDASSGADEAMNDTDVPRVDGEERAALRPREPSPSDPALESLRSVRELCHDLVNPALTIRVLAEAAAVESQLDPATNYRLRQIVEEAERIAEICTYFLERPRHVHPLRLDIVAADIVNATRFSYEGAISAVTEPVTIAMHQVVVTRVLRNLLENGCRAAGPTGRIRLTVSRADGEARLEVADSGPGFGAGPAGRASLGLDIVETLVRDRGGSTTLATSDLGGVSVIVSFPLSKDQDLGPMEMGHHIVGGSIEGDTPPGGMQL